MKMAKRQGLVSIEGIPGLWATKTGGNVTSAATPVWDGGATEPDMLAAPAAADNVSVSRPVDDQRDLPELRSLRKQVGKLRATITVQPTDADLFPIGDPVVYSQALLVGFNEPEVDAASGDPSEIQLDWAISQFT